MVVQVIPVNFSGLRPRSCGAAVWGVHGVILATIFSGSNKVQAADWGLDRKGVFGPTMKASNSHSSAPSSRRASAAWCRLGRHGRALHVDMAVPVQFA